MDHQDETYNSISKRAALQITNIAGFHCTITVGIFYDICMPGNFVDTALNVSL